MLISERKLRETIRSVLLENYYSFLNDITSQQIYDMLHHAFSHFHDEEYMDSALRALCSGSSYKYIDREKFIEDFYDNYDVIRSVISSARNNPRNLRNWYDNYDASLDV